MVLFWTFIVKSRDHHLEGSGTWWRRIAVDPTEWMKKAHSRYANHLGEKKQNKTKKIRQRLATGAGDMSCESFHRKDFWRMLRDFVFLIPYMFLLLMEMRIVTFYYYKTLNRIIHDGYWCTLRTHTKKQSIHTDVRPHKYTSKWKHIMSRTPPSLQSRLFKRTLHPPTRTRQKALPLLLTKCFSFSFLFFFAERRCYFKHEAILHGYPARLSIPRWHLKTPVLIIFSFT